MVRAKSITQEMTGFLRQAGLPISIQELFNTVLAYKTVPQEDSDSIGDEDCEYGLIVVKDFEIKTQNDVLQITLWGCDLDEKDAGVAPDEDGKREYTEFVYNYEFDDEGEWYWADEESYVVLEVTRLFDPAKRKRSRPEQES